MEFPAVTICGFNLIPRHNLKEANLQYMDDLTNVLNSLPIYNISLVEKIRCLKDPLCRYSRFLDKCYCEQNVCGSTECYPYKNRSVCACAEAVCSPLVTDTAEGCSLKKDDGYGLCLCRRDFDNPRYTPETENLNLDFLEAVKRLDLPPRAKNLLKQIKNVTGSSFRDIEPFVKPNIMTRDNYGISYDNMIISCTFGSMPCNVSRDVSTLYSPGYGKCYMFNYAGEQNALAKPKLVNHAGRSNGLELYLKNPESGALSLLTSQYGARVVIHDPRSLPFASENGYNIRSEDMASVRVHYKETNRLGPPWGDCARDGDNTTSSYLDIPYDKLGCQRKCVNEYILRHCNCQHPSFLSGTVVPNRRSICRKRHDSCVEKLLKSGKKKMKKCHCPSACKEKMYEVSISGGILNTEFFSILKMARSLTVIDGKPTVIEPDVMIGMMGLQVYFGSFAITNITETSIYSWEFLIANIGGNMGLFLGLSLITFVEITEFMVDIFTKKICQKRLKDKRRNWIVYIQQIIYYR